MQEKILPGLKKTNHFVTIVSFFIEKEPDLGYNKINMKGDWAVISATNYPRIYVEWSKAIDDFRSGTLKGVMTLDRPIVEVIKDRSICLTRYKDTFFSPENVLTIRAAHVVSASRITRDSKFVNKLNKVKKGGGTEPVQSLG